MFDPSLVGTIAGILGISVRELISAVMKAQRKWREEREEREWAEKKARITQLIMKSFVTKALVRYYLVEDLGDLSCYSVIVDGTPLYISIATKPNWVELSIELDGPTEQCYLVSANSPKSRVPVEYAANLIANIEERGLKLWNAPIYRLVDISIGSDQINAYFALDEFMRYRFTIGLLLEELIEAIIASNFDIDTLVAHKERLLPLRHDLLRDGNDLLSFGDRMCAGGPLALFAMARPTPYNDYALLIQRRSKLVADAQEMLSVIPKAFHQPMVDPSAEIALSWTIYRELYEELLGGAEAEKEVKRIRHDWFLQECRPIRWLLNHKNAYTLECVCFGINLITGNYEFGILLAVHDTYFWKQYSRRILANWEVARIDRIVSSKDTRQIKELMLLPDWVGEGLFVFVEGLKRLNELSPQKVSLPSIALAL